MSLLELKGISVRFGGIVALDNINLSVEEGKIFGLIGPNGAGKTTLINMISCLIKPTTGIMKFSGSSPCLWSMETAVRHGIVRTFQQTRAFLGLTVAENLRIAQGASNEDVNINDLVEVCGLQYVMDRVAHDLPYVMLRHLGIALALALKPKLLLLDEPAVGLTAHELERLGSLIRRCNSTGMTILLVEHNIRFLMSLAESVAVLDQGKVIFIGTPEECQEEPKVIEVYLGRRA